MSKIGSFGPLQQKAKLLSPKNIMANHSVWQRYGNMTISQIKVTHLFLQENSILNKFISLSHVAWNCSWCEIFYKNAQWLSSQTPPSLGGRRAAEQSTFYFNFFFIFYLFLISEWWIVYIDIWNVSCTVGERLWKWWRS